MTDCRFIPGRTADRRYRQLHPHEPLGYALYAFPWGEDGTELAHASGPRQWQADAFREIGEHLQNPATRHQPLMIARASGHGIGKSAFISMLINWCHVHL